MKNNQPQKNIPSEWQQVKLGDCLVIKHGKSQKEIEVIDGKYPILATGGVIGRTNTALYSKPSVLIGRKGTIDKPRYMDTPFWTIDTLFYSQIKENSVPKYLFYKFNTIKWYDYNEASGVPSLSATTISLIKFNLPPLIEQNHIVSVLETWDESIKKLIQKIEAKKQIKKGLMEDLLTGKKRLKGFGDKWETKKLGEISTIKKGESITKKDITDGNVPVIAGGQQPAYFHNQSNRIGKTITVSASGAYAGYVDFYNQPIFVSDCTGIQESEVNIDFLYFYMKLKQQYIYSLQSGGAQPHVQPKDLQNIKVLFPESKKEQTVIAQILTITHKEITTLQKKLSVLKEQKKYLLNNLITGTIRTPEKLSTKLTK